jgi:uncharacterized protein YgiM (DUF1202 family)
MKTIVILFIATSLLADSKTEKELSAKSAVLEESLRDAAKEKAAIIASADQRTLVLHQEVARQAQEIATYKLRVANLTDENTALQSKLRSTIEGAKFQATIAKNLSEKPIIPPVPVRVDMGTVHEIRKSQIEGREIAEQRNEAVLKTVATAVKTAEKAASTADATLHAVKSQTSATDRIKSSILMNDAWLIVVTLLCDVLARLWYGRITSNRLITLAILGAKHTAGLEALKDAFERMEKESSKKA